MSHALLKFKRENAAELRTELLSRLPAVFSIKSAMGVADEADINELLVCGLLRKQGACYYRKDGVPPTLDQAMMIDMTNVTIEELSDMDGSDFMAALLPHLSRRKYLKVMHLMKPKMELGVGAVVLVRWLYQIMSPKSWGWFVIGVNKIAF